MGISLLMAMLPPTPPRSFISAALTTAPPKTIPTGSPKHGQCTHLTMARIYTTDFRCSYCFRPGPSGWLYRCTQDRELLLEDNYHWALIERFDELPTMFDKPVTPRPRGPEARQGQDSFLEEMSDQQRNGYSLQQLEILHTQKDNLRSVLSESEELNPAPNASKQAKTTKPWSPPPGGECQFKCCPRCRPSLVDRTYLSLDGIVKNDVPMTAITGFGFHLQQTRPVALIKHVQNLGLRKNPEPPHFILNTPTATLPPKHQEGLGIFTGESQQETNQKPPPPGLPIPADHPLRSILGNGTAYHPSVEAAFTRFLFPQTTSASPPPQRPLPALPSRPNCPPPKNPPILSPAKELPLPLHVLISSPLISALETEELESRRPLTPMEKDEFDLGKFGDRPLDVGDGVAVKEEGVELHCADLVGDEEEDSGVLLVNGFSVITQV